MARLTRSLPPRVNREAPPGGITRCRVWPRRRDGGAQRGLGRVQRFEDLLAGGLRPDRRVEPRVAQGEREARQEVQVRADGRADQREQRADRLTVQGAEVDGTLEEAKRDRRARQVQDDRVAHVRDRDAVSDPRRSERLAREQHLIEELAIDVVGQLHGVDHGAKDRGLVVTADPVVDAARAQRVLERRRRLRLALRLGEDLGRHVDLLRGRPLEELRAVDPILVVDPIGREQTLLDPAVDALLRDVQKRRRLAHGQLLQCGLSLPCEGRPLFPMDHRASTMRIGID